MKRFTKIAISVVSASLITGALLVTNYSVAASKKEDKNLSSGKTSTSMKVAVVDYMTVFQLVPQGKVKLMELKDKVKPLIKSLQEKQTDLQAKMQALQKEAPTLTDKQKRSREDALVKQQMSFQKEVNDLQQKELAKEQAAATQFQDAVRSAVKVVGKKDGYDLVLNSQAVPYSNVKYDLSHEVIAQMKKVSS